jgi:uncharacterized protein
MIIPDLNLLIYAYNSESKHHQKARAWWTECLQNEERVSIPAVVVFGFLRTMTNARIFSKPMTLKRALSHVREWVKQPNVFLMEKTHYERAFILIEEAGAGGNLVTDAQIAAISIEEGAVVHTHDTDFGRFSGIRCFDPLAV